MQTTFSCSGTGFLAVYPLPRPRLWIFYQWLVLPPAGALRKWNGNKIQASELNDLLESLMQLWWEGWLKLQFKRKFLKIIGVSINPLIFCVNYYEWDAKIKKNTFTRLISGHQHLIQWSCHHNSPVESCTGKCSRKFEYKLNHKSEHLI